MTKTFRTAEELFFSVRASLLNAEQSAPPIPQGAIPSHIRIRSQTEEQFVAFAKIAMGRRGFKALYRRSHKGRDILWCLLCEPLSIHFQTHNVEWLEFTPPAEAHANGPDALVFKIEGTPTSWEEPLTESPPFFFRFQGASAEDIVSR